MSKVADHRSAISGTGPEAFRHLPDTVSLEDTVASIRGDSPSPPSGEANAFIAAAVNAGG